MKYELQMTSRFKKDFKVISKRGYKKELLQEVLQKLQNGESLPAANHDHALKGNWIGYRECHIQPDWLLVYRIFEDKLILSLTRTGSHSDLDLY